MNPKRKRVRYLPTIAVTWCFLFLLTSVTAVADSKKVIARVNGAAITEKDLMEEVNRRLPLKSFHAGVSEERFNEIRRQALEKLIEDELLYQEARRRNLKVDPAALESRIRYMKSGYTSEKLFRRKLKKMGMSYDQWVERIKRRLLIEQIEKLEILDKVVVTDADARRYYEQNKQKFVRPDRLRLRHILISVPPGAMGKGWEEGLKKAKRVYKRITSGEDFAAVAKDVSDDTTSAEKGGDIGWVHVGQLIPELDGVARNMKIGEVSKPIRTIYGFHILKLEAREPSRQLSFDEIDRETLKKKLRRKWIEERRKAFVEKLRAKAKITLPDWYGG